MNKQKFIVQIFLLDKFLMQEVPSLIVGGRDSAKRNIKGFLSRLCWERDRPRIMAS